jgi:hypothetical protein
MQIFITIMLLIFFMLVSVGTLQKKSWYYYPEKQKFFNLFLFNKYFREAYGEKYVFFCGLLYMLILAIIIFSSIVSIIK